MTKRLCIDLRWIDCSGIGTYIKCLMPGLIAQLADVAIVGLGAKDRLLELPWTGATNVEIIDCNADRYSLGEQLALPLAIPGDIDLFFSPHYPIPLLYRGRLIVTVHDLSHLVVPEIVRSFSKRFYAKTMLAAVRKRASLILTVSEFSRSELLRCTKGNCADNVLTIHEGISEEWYGAAQFPPPRKNPYIVYVGNVKPYKNVSRLVDAFNRVMKQLPHDLVIIGKNEGFITGEAQPFFEQVKCAGDRIHLTGSVTQQELLAYVGNATALIMPSLYEGFGFPPVEAMAAGVPTLVARSASLPEICGDATLYCDPYNIQDIADKLVTIVSDETLRCRLTKAGLAQAKRYSWECCAVQTANAMRSLL